MALSILSRRLHCLLLIALLVVVLAGCGAYGTGNNGGGGNSTFPSKGKYESHQGKIDELRGSFMNLVPF